MNFGRALGWVAISAFLFSMIGATIGYATGILMPDYYQSIHNAKGDPGFSAAAVGVGEGLLRGFMWGTWIGIVLAGLYTWKDMRQADSQPTYEE